MKIFIIYMSVTIALAACATSPTLPASQQFTPTQHPIRAFSTLTTSVTNISIGKILIVDQFNYYLANPDGSGEVLLHSGGEQFKMASLSPDATKFAYFMGNFVYIQDIKTGQTKPLNQEIIGSMGGQIRWSPDGTHLALQCAKAGQPTLGICLIDTETGQIEVLVNETNTDEFCSSTAAFIMLQDWSQDGSTMVYSCFILSAQGQKQQIAIYLYDLASKSSRKVFDGRLQSTMWSLSSASISPDNSYLLITGNRQDYILQVFLLDLSNANLKQLTNDPSFNSSALLWRGDSKTFYTQKSSIQIPYTESSFVMNTNGNILSPVGIIGTIIK